MPSLLDLLGETWPARMAKSAWSAAKLPGDVYAGRTDPLSDEGIGRATDLAGMVMGGTYGGAPAGATGIGPVRGYHGSSRADLSSIKAAPEVRQFDNATSQFGAYFSPNQKGAERYGQNIYSAEAGHLTNPYEMSADEFLRFQAPNKGADGKTLPSEAWAGRAEELKREAAKYRDELSKAGHDGIIVRRNDGTIMEMSSFGDVPNVKKVTIGRQNYGGEE